ncbi:MAG: hypothetical protein V7637_5806 [Mycobacteriales bacterium]|jgi:hypothetical protein
MSRLNAEDVRGVRTPTQRNEKWPEPPKFRLLPTLARSYPRPAREAIIPIDYYLAVARFLV